MKLIEILEPLFESGIPDNKLSGDNLKLIKNLILKCDEFKDVKELNILGQACMGGKNRYGCTIHKLSNDFSFKGVVNIFQFIRTPPMYDINDLIKSNSIISPVYNKPENPCDPKRKIVMEVDLIDITHNRKKILNVLEDILDYPQEYEPKPFYGYMVSGVFENFVNGN